MKHTSKLGEAIFSNVLVCHQHKPNSICNHVKVRNVYDMHMILNGCLQQRISCCCFIRCVSSDSFALFSAVFCQLSCNVSALACSVMQLICCDKLATRYQLSYYVQAHLPSAITVAICLLSHDMSVHSAAVCHCKCVLSAWV